jgi:hypothetical protein
MYLSITASEFRDWKRLCFIENLIMRVSPLQLPNIKSRFWLYALLVVAVLIFLFCHERQISGYDPASFVLAIKYGYSVQQARPHGPGYPGFYLLWKAIDAVTGFSPHGTILAANLGFTLLAIVLTYFASRKFYNERTALIAALFVLTNPLLLYFGNCTELYAYDAAFSAFLVILLVVPTRFEIGLYFLYGLLGSFRLSSFILTVPVVLTWLVIRYIRDRSLSRLLKDTVAIAIGMLAWLIPFVINIGGWQAFVDIMRGVGDLPTTLVQNLGRFVPAMFWMVNVLFILAAMNIGRIWNKLGKFDTRYIVLTLLIVVPSLFFAFRYYEKGYALLIFAPIAIMGARLIERGRHTVLISLCVVAVNLLLFFAVPFVPPSATSFLNHRHRTSGERLRSFVLRETSFFAPTFSHLRASDYASEISNRLIGTLQAGSSITIDMSAAQWAYARTLQAEHPEMIFLVPSESDTAMLRRFAGDSLDYHYTWDEFANDLRGKAGFYYLTDRQLPFAIGAPPGNFLTATGHIALFYVPRDSFEVLKNYDRTYFYHGEE